MTFEMRSPETTSAFTAWQWRIVDEEGKELARSDRYPSEATCSHDINRVKSGITEQTLIVERHFD